MKEKFKELTKDTAIYGISTILSRFLNFILVPFYTNVFSTAEFGIQNTIYSYIAFFNIIYLYGMDSAFLKYASMKEERDSRTVFSTSFLFVLLTSVIFSILIVSFKPAISPLIDLPVKQSGLLNYVSLILFFDALTMIPFGHLRLIRKAKKFALIRTINIIINVALNLILILKYHMGIEAVFISNLAASIFSLAALLPDILSNISFKLRLDSLKELLKFGIPYLPAGLASIVIQVIDRPVLQKLTNESTVGIYSANYKLGIFMMLYVSMFQFAWQPFFLNNAKLKNAKEIFGKVLTYFVLVGSIVLVLLSLFIDDLVKIQIFNHRSIIESAYWGGLNIIPIILLAYLFNGIYVNLTAGIFIEGKTQFIPYITGLGAFINIAFNFLLIPVIGIMGAALATLASYVVMAIGLYFVVQNFYKIEYEYKKLLKICISLILTGLLYYSVAINHIFYKMILFVFFFFLLYLFKVVKISDVKSMRNLFRFDSRSERGKNLSNTEDVIK
ncbi:MAG: flippase [Ignavibacteriales bacterium]|nr:flippase [Ignavibacteriales bacterium]